MRFIKYASLEVVLGAVFYQFYLFQTFFRVFPSITEGLALALSVWLIYLLDRQVDNVLQPSLDQRHQFHQENRLLLRGLIFMIVCGIALLLPLLPTTILVAGFGMILTVLAYGFACHKGWLRLEKEVFTAILYGLGVGLVVWVREPRALLSVMTLVALAYQNLCYFSLIEQPNPFFASRLRKTEWVLLGLLSGNYASSQDLFTILPFLVTFGLTFILSRLTFSEEKRIWGDLAFWSPLIYLLHGIFST